MSAPRAADFERRAALYTRYDAQLCEYTRFFAAAAMVNTVLAKRFSAFPAIQSSRSFSFLNQVGAALETDNWVYAREISRRAPGGALDHALVCAEQAQLQRCVNAQQAQHPQHWEATRSELNGLLNDQYAASLLCRWCEVSGRLSRALREVRGHLGMKLDFAMESHRIRIGLKLIEYIRRESTTPSGGPAGVSTRDAGPKPPDPVWTPLQVTDAPHSRPVKLSVRRAEKAALVVK